MKPFKEADEYSEDLQAAYDYYKAYGQQPPLGFCQRTNAQNLLYDRVPSSAEHDATAGGR